MALRIVILTYLEGSNYYMIRTSFMICLSQMHALINYTGSYFVK